MGNGERGKRKGSNVHRLSGLKREKRTAASRLAGKAACLHG